MKVKIVESEEELRLAQHIRVTVFVDEKHVPAEKELDTYEQTATHFLGYEDNQPVAASRIRFIENTGKLERICILKEHRGKFFGQQLIAEMEKFIKSKGVRAAKLHALTDAEPFYTKLGYQTVSKPFTEAGMQHVTMVKDF